MYVIAIWSENQLQRILCDIRKLQNLNYSTHIPHLMSSPYLFTILRSSLTLWFITEYKIVHTDLVQYKFAHNLLLGSSPPTIHSLQCSHPLCLSLCLHEHTQSHIWPACRRCVDINECLEQTADCNPSGQLCLNTRGSFHCRDRAHETCMPGFELDEGFRRCQGQYCLVARI